MSVNTLAKQRGIGTARLNEIVRGERGISAGTALCLARYFDTWAEFWLDLQLEYVSPHRAAENRQADRAAGQNARKQAA